MSCIGFQEDHFDSILLTKFCNLDSVMPLKPISIYNDGKLYSIFLAMLKEVFQDLDGHLSGNVAIFCDGKPPDSRDSCNISFEIPWGKVDSKSHLRIKATCYQTQVRSRLGQVQVRSRSGLGQVQVRSRSFPGQVQVLFRLQLKFNSIELDSDVG